MIYIMSDIEIARGANKKNILDIAKDIGIDEKNLLLYGNDKAKVTLKADKSIGKLILVTAINPTPYGEGKTTVSIGLADAFKKLNKTVIAALREPSMGPVFGMKGGATGGGYSQVVPMEDINLHFTGDFHAITSANNLLCAAIDNHIEQGNSLDIKEVLFHRCLDVNDRELRKISLKNREEEFTITAASEMMAIFCLAQSINDLKERLGNIIIGKNSDNEYIYANQLNIEGSLVTLLKDAFYPNLVQTLENTPVFIHGGPFANIAHGCNSLYSTKLALSLSDYVITEAGFGADLGAEKFYDIKCRIGNLKPDCTVLVATVRALKYNGDNDLSKGIINLEGHIKNIKQNNSNLVVCINKFEDDSEEDLEYIKVFCKNLGIDAVISTAYENGGLGAISLAEKVIEVLNKDNEFSTIYNDKDSIKEKIEKLSKNIYHAGSVVYSNKAEEIIREIEKKNLSYLPICVAKTQYSFSDDKENLGCPKNYTINVKDIRLYNGAGFITIYLGNILTMPGLPKKPNYEKISMDSNDNIIGLS